MHQTLEKIVVYIVSRLVVMLTAVFILLSIGIAVMIIVYSTEDPLDDASCNVAVVPINGFITTSDNGMDNAAVSADKIIERVDKAESEDHIKAIMVVIDSYGGHPVASEMVSNALLNTAKPTVAVIREGGTSGAYMVATGADRIIASSMSDVGSIGVTFSYIETAEQTTAQGGRFIELVAGDFKEMGNPDKKLTQIEYDIFQRDLDSVYDGFVSLVSRNRSIPKERVLEIADGSSMNGHLAQQYGLVDEIGDQGTAKKWIQQQTGEEITLCGE